MNRRTVYVACVLIAAVLVWSLSRSPSPTGGASASRDIEPSSADGSETGSASELASAVPSRAEVEPVSRTTVDEASPESAGVPFAVVGRVVDDLGAEPIAGLIVRLGVRSDAEGQRELEAQTDDQGRFRFEFPAGRSRGLPGAWVSDLSVSPAETHGPGRSEVRQRAEAGGEVEREIVVPRGATLSGTVRDLEGLGVPGAAVEVWLGDLPERTPREPDRVVPVLGSGDFRLTHVGGPFELRARAPGWAAERALFGEVATGEVREDLDLLLARAVAVEGVVLAGGEPLEGVVVKLGGSLQVTQFSWSGGGASPVADGVRSKAAGVREATTDERGEFRIEEVPDGTGQRSFPGFSLGCQPAGLPPYVLEGVAPGERAVLELPALTGIFGRVVDDQGQPLAGARVVLCDLVEGQRRTDSGDNGEFEFLLSSEAQAVGAAQVKAWGGGEDPGPLGVSALVRAEGWGLAHVPDLEPWRRGERPDLVIPLSPAQSISGRLESLEGLPLNGIQMQLRSGERVPSLTSYGDEVISPEFVLGLDKTTTTGGGEFTLDGLPSGEFELLSGPLPGSVARQVDRVVAGQQDVLIRFDAAAMERVVLTGRVTNAETGEPVPSFTVFPSRRGTSTTAGRSFEDPDGRFRLEGLEPGFYELDVRAEGFARTRRPGQDLSTGTHEFEVRLELPSQVAILVQNEFGDPVQGGRLSFRDDAGDVVMVSKQPDHMTVSSSAFLDSNPVTLYDPPSGSLAMTYTGGGYDQTFQVDLGAHRNGTFEVLLAPPLPEEPPIPSIQVSSGLFRADPSNLGPGSEPSDVPWLDASVTYTGLDAEGAATLVGKLELKEDGTFEERTAYKNQSSFSPNVPFPMLNYSFPPETLSVRIEAEGYRTRTLTLEPGRYEGDSALPRFIVLARD